MKLIQQTIARGKGGALLADARMPRGSVAGWDGRTFLLRLARSGRKCNHFLNVRATTEKGQMPRGSAAPWHERSKFRQCPGALPQGPLLRLLSCLLFACFPATLFAATLSLDPASGSYAPGDTFVLTIRLDLEPDECINAAHVELLYPAEKIKASAVSKGESLLTLFTEEPSVDHERGIISFEGGIPGGYCGRIQGDPGKTNILGKIVLSIPGNMIGGDEVKEPIPLDVSFAPDTQVLLSDGLGTPTALTLSGGRYLRLTESSGQRNEWLDIVHADTLPPEPFTIAIINDPQIFDGKHFIVFSTTDKQSGVDHFEVMEDDTDRPGFIEKSSKKSIFISAMSPYVLTDQTLQSRIIVRALDHAGNVQEVIEMPEGKMVSDRAGLSALADWRLLIVPILAIATIVLYWYLRRRKNEFTPPDKIGSP